MREKARVKRPPAEYADLIAKARRDGEWGYAEWLETRFDRDYPPEEATA